MEIQDFIDKVNQKIDSELLWCGGDRNKSSEMKNWRKAYSDVKKWMKELSKEINQLDDENLNDNKMEQTAVEWLIFHWMELDKKYYGGEIGRIDYRNQRETIQVEAKEMEKQQIIDAVTFGQNNNTVMIQADLEIAEQYYNKTFKNK